MMSQDTAQIQLDQHAVPPAPPITVNTTTQYNNNNNNNSSSSSSIETFASQIKKSGSQQSDLPAHRAPQQQIVQTPAPQHTQSVGAVAYTTPTPTPESQTELRDKGEAIVKQVLSGDTLILRALKGVNGPPKEKQVSLTMVQAPKLAKRPGPEGRDRNSQDEPFAWMSREFLRKQLVGKVVQYNIEITVGSSKHVARIMLNNENISEKILQCGMAKLRDHYNKKGNEDYERIMKMRDEVESQKIGVYADATPDAIRNINYISSNMQLFVESKQDRLHPAVIEQLINGHTLRIALTDTHEHLSIQLTGIRCPSTQPQLANTGDIMEDPDLSARVKFAVESKLLQRDVQLRFDGVSGQMALATVFHPKGNITEFLLSEGYARIVPWSLKRLPDTETQEHYQRLEDEAKRKGLRIWASMMGAGASSPQKMLTQTIEKKSFNAKVIEIVSAEQIVVRGLDKGTEQSHRLFFSSLRGPKRDTSTDPSSRGTSRRSDRSDSGARPVQRPLYDLPFFFEARECLRKWLIGKKVIVEVDYIRQGVDGYPDRTCCSIIAATPSPSSNTSMQTRNVAELLILKGYATVFKHRQNDDNRSPYYDLLVKAEDTAIREARGMHCKKNPENATIKVSEVAADVAKAKTFLNSLQRMGKISCIVEYVVSGNRFRVYIPKEQILVSFILSGVNCPRAANTLQSSSSSNNSSEEPYASEACNFTKELIYQRDVQIMIESIDKGGNFIGTLFENGKNLAQQLLQEGLGFLHSSGQGPNFSQLQAAESSARDKKLRIWENYDETSTNSNNNNNKDDEDDRFNDEDDDYNRQSSRDRPGASFNVSTSPSKFTHDSFDFSSNTKAMLVTEISSPNTLWAQPLTTSNAVNEISVKLREYFNEKVTVGVQLKKNLLVASKFLDGSWYRAQITQVVSTSKASVHYIDFGNSQVVSADNIKQLPQQFHSLPAQAKEYQLILTLPPPDEEWTKETTKELTSMVINKKVHIQSFGKFPTGNFDQAIVYLSENIDDDLGRLLISDGLLMVDSKNKTKRFSEMLHDYQSEQKNAKSKHLNLWEYGDIREDFVPEFGYNVPTPASKTKATTTPTTTDKNTPNTDKTTNTQIPEKESNKKK